MEKAYETYKDSGVEWIGEIPESWITAKFKYFATIKNGRDQKQVISENGKYPILGTGGEFGRSNEYLHNRPSVLLGRKGTIDKPQFITEPFWTVDTLFYTDIRKEVDAKFLYYVSTIFPFDLLQESSAVPSMTQGKLNNLFVVKPSAQEQTQIATYLDYHTQLIDTLISKKETLIQKLQEQRQAIINEAVTKGLNKNVALKDSGIEWLGEIPQHWEVKKLKYICEAFGRIGYRGYTTSDIVEKGKGAITISPSNILPNNMNFDTSTYLSWEKYDESPEIKIYNDDIIMVKTGSTYGKVGIVKNLKEKATINPQLLVFKNLRINPDFLFELLRMPSIQYQVETGVIGSTIPTISQTKILDFYVAIPSDKNEVNEIVQFINKSNHSIDISIKKINTSIQKLKDYRQSLISEAVTGKIDVRDWQKPNS